MSYVPTATATWGKENIQQLLTLSDYAVHRAVLVIYQNQTEGERSGGVLHVNGIGFNKYDARELIPLARRIEDGYEMTTAEMRWVRPKMLKYWKQLAEIANEKTKG